MNRPRSPKASRAARRLAEALLLAIACAAAGAAPPLHLRDTGLYADTAMTLVRPEDLSYSPQYPLWFDGADKQRWIRLPRGAFIDAGQPDAWRFPPGTRLWKQFSQGGRRIETRYMERRADGGWDYATYVWNEDGSDALRAPAATGARLALSQAPGGVYSVPSSEDCLACHESAATPVLGVSALQLSPDRDPLAPHAAPVRPGDLDLRRLQERGLLRGLPAALRETPPRIAASSPTERAALGYLHGNCGHCHNDNGAPAPVGLVLAQQVAAAAASRDKVFQTSVERPSRFRSAAWPELTRLIVPGRPQASLLVARMRSRHAALQMPPLGTAAPDSEGLALIERWITNDLSRTKELAP